MSRFEHAFRRIADDLDRIGVGWALVGGLAVNIYTIPRRYRDIDISVVAPDAAAELADALRACGHHVYLAQHDSLGLIVVVHVMLAEATSSGVLIDLLPQACGFEPELVAAAPRLDVFGAPAPVARIGHLIACKAKAVADVDRARDRRDLLALLARADSEELELARAALRLSRARGGLRAGDPLEVLELFHERFA
jgi:hypothetical protein